MKAIRVALHRLVGVSRPVSKRIGD
jgi:hypothetical protein